ncbi:serine hydrolase [Herbaspirillum lusitanum]|uniref:Serine hydrolase n=1 Tax=Herbaspirillum lusitanum TaxID=213312 RepID=A0ABW9A8D5_9BURK
MSPVTISRATPDTVRSAVVRDGKLIAADPQARPVLWWSFGKTVLAAAALALVRDGRVGLDAPLAAQGYTLRQLLCHTAGIPNYSDLSDYAHAVARKDAPWTVVEMLERVQHQQLQFAPGQGWAYSNTGYLLVRQLIEATVGSDLQSALDMLVFKPLASSDTGDVALAETPEDLLATDCGNPGDYHPRWVYHGLLTGTPASAALLLDRLLDGQLLPAPLLEQMLRMRPLGNTLPGRPGVDFGYGLGMMIAQSGPAGRSIGHTGSGPGSVAAVYRFPERACTVACFAAVGDQAVVEWAAHKTAASLPA